MNPVWQEMETYNTYDYYHKILNRIKSPTGGNFIGTSHAMYVANN